MDAKCPHCGTIYEIDSADIGATCSCSVCGNKFVVRPIASMRAAYSRGLKAPGFLSLLKGEDVLRVERPSLLVKLFFLIGCAVIAFVGIVLMIAASKSNVEGMEILTGIGLVVMLAALGAAAAIIIREKSACFVLTNLRLVSKHGLFGINQTEVRVDDIRAVNMKRGIWQRVIGVGDVVVGTAATSGVEIACENIPHPKSLMNDLNALRGA